MCLGKHNLTYEETSEQCFGVSGIYRHEGFKYPTVPTVEFDIALVRLDGEVTPTDEISYACLPPMEEVLPGGKKCYATGWGDETGTKPVVQHLHVYTHFLHSSVTFIAATVYFLS